MQQTSGQKKNNTQNKKGGFYMFNKFKHIKNEKGLTLIELLAVIVILAIIAVIAIPAIGNIINTSRDKAQVSDALNIIAGGKLAHIEENCGGTGCDAKLLDPYVDGIDVTGMTVKLDGDEWKISGFTFTFTGNKFEKDPLNGKSEATENALKALIDEKADTTEPTPGG